MTSEWTISAIVDKHTCDHCRIIAGRISTDPSDPSQLMSKCEHNKNPGDSQCRCTIVPVPAVPLDLPPELLECLEDETWTCNVCDPGCTLQSPVGESPDTCPWSGSTRTPEWEGQ